MIVIFATEINEVKANQQSQSCYCKKCPSTIFKSERIKSKSSILTQNAIMYFYLPLYWWGLRQEPGSAPVRRTVSLKSCMKKVIFWAEFWSSFCPDSFSPIQNTGKKSQTLKACKTSVCPLSPTSLAVGFVCFVCFSKETSFSKALPKDTSRYFGTTRKNSQILIK